jgi:membrane protease YdiL (CAAX protease family)
MPEWPTGVPANRHIDRHVHGPGLGRERARSFGWFLLAVLYALLAEQIAPRIASLFAPGVFFPFVSSLLFLALLLVGFSAMAMLGQRQSKPVARMGLVRRPGAMREWGLGTALGWAGIVACVLPVALIGGLAVNLNNQSFLYGLTALCIDFLTLLTASLAAEVLFRGYPFQRLIETTGVTLASLLVSLLFAVDRMGSEPLSLTSFLVTFLLGLLLSMAYLRTRALWVGWGFHFAWSASTAILFGLPISGRTEFSPIISNYTAGPEWLTGGGVGPEGSLTALVVLLVLIFVLARATRELRHRWAIPEIVGAGIPVDIDGLARQQHAEGMGPGAGVETGTPSPAPSLVQIAPAPRHDPPQS